MVFLQITATVAADARVLVGDNLPLDAFLMTQWKNEAPTMAVSRMSPNASNK